MIHNLYIILLFIIFLILFYFINIFFKKMENFCYGNTYCNGNNDSALCINQTCKKCGLMSPCDKDSECYPNNCINGCCDQL